MCPASEAVSAAGCSTARQRQCLSGHEGSGDTRHTRFLGRHEGSGDTQGKGAVSPALLDRVPAPATVAAALLSARSRQITRQRHRLRDERQWKSKQRQCLSRMPVAQQQEEAVSWGRTAVGTQAEATVPCDAPARRDSSAPAEERLSRLAIHHRPLHGKAKAIS